MVKPPAFQFYPDDFIGGTATMTHEERGFYILALCVQWSKGGISRDEFDRLGRGLVEPSLNHCLTKFEVGSDGLLRNSRLEQERDKQAAYRKLQSEKGQASAKARFNRGSTVVQPKGEPEGNSPSPSPSPSTKLRESTRACAGEAVSPEMPQDALEGVNGYQHPAGPSKRALTANGDAHRPSLNEVLSHADIIGLAHWRAQDWHDEMEAGGWLDHQHRPVQNWQAMLRRVRTKWEADGRPSQPLARNGKPAPLKPDHSKGF